QRSFIVLYRGNAYLKTYSRRDGELVKLKVIRDNQIPMILHAKFHLAMILLLISLVACSEQGNANMIEEVEKNLVDSKLPTMQVRSEVVEEVSLSQDIESLILAGNI